MGKMRIAIDGPAGAGKSTVARLVARRLDYLYIDTGAMYRALTWKAMALGILLKDGDALTDLAKKTHIKLVNIQGRVLVICDGKDVSAEIRSPQVSENVSQVAMVPGVRRRMIQLQREMAVAGGVVMDGRDICTEVLPDADCKIFLTASIDERAHRRWEEFRQNGFQKTEEEVKSDLILRDLMDMGRETGPLRQSPDAVLIDSTGYSAEQVAQKIMELCAKEV